MMLDFHNHLMPGVDDGARDINESREGLAAMEAQGVRVVIATPHIGASLTHHPARLDEYLANLDVAYDALCNLATTEFPNLRVERGVELALDLPSPRLGDKRLHLAGSDFVLVEFPHMMIPPNSWIPIRDLRSLGVIPIIAHPERYGNMAGNLNLVETWRESGAFIQVNAGSLIGQYGSTPKRIVWQLLQEGLADYMCSDYHARGRLSIQAAGNALTEKGAAEIWRTLTVINPGKMLASEPPLPVAPVEDIQLGFWKKVFGR